MTTVDKLYDLLTEYSSANFKAEQYYEGDVVVDKLNISTPPILNHIKTVIGWPGTCVDVLEERLDFLGWDDDGKFGLEDAFIDNSMDNESSLADLDTLIYGTGFISISTGFNDLPPAIVTAESPLHTTGLWDRRARRLVEGFTRYADEEGKFTKAVHYELNQTSYYRRDNENSNWVLDRVDKHNLNRLPLVRLVNRGRAGRPGGKSEITKAIRSYTNTAVRTLLGMEVNREFFQAPQRYVLGAKDDAFYGPDGQPIPGWKAIMGSLWNIERDSEWAEHTEYKQDGLPQVGQFPANPPGPYLEQIKGLSLLVSAESGMPPSYLGFATDNPPSADSIRALEARLVKRAERRQSAWTPGYAEVGQVAGMLLNGGKTLPKRSDLQVLWRDASTPTKAADGDRATKLVAATILPPDSQVTYEMAGLTPRQIKRLEKDRTKAQFMQVLTEGLGGNVPTDKPNQPANPADSVPPVGPAK
ncbi:MAG: phage portal protein [Actinobacteria bacterium]|nr:phage portal protein [Actinomycetota bacterium]